MQAWRSLLKESELVEKEVRQFIKTGQRSIVDEYLVESQTEEARTQLADYDSRAKEELQLLSILIGLKEDLNCPEVDQINIKIDGISEQKAGIFKKTEAQLKVSEENLNVSEANYYPEVIGLASIGAFERARLVPKQDYAIALGVRFPLFDGLRTTHEFHEARARLDADSESLNAMKVQLSFMNHRFDRKIVSATIRLEHLQTEFALAQKGFLIAKRRYFSFEGKLIDLRESLRNLSRVLAQRIEAKAELEKEKSEKLVLNGGA